jgi:hypothetical protein
MVEGGAGSAEPRRILHCIVVSAQLTSSILKSRFEIKYSIPTHAVVVIGVVVIGVAVIGAFERKYSEVIYWVYPVWFLYH